MPQSIEHYTFNGQAVYTNLLRQFAMNLLSERIQTLLDENPQLDQVKLGIAAGASRALVNHWIAGKVKTIAIEYALAIEENLQYGHIWLMTGKGAKKVAKELSYEGNSTLYEIMHAAQELSEYKKTLALNIIHSLAQTPDKADIDAINAQALEIEAIDKHVRDKHPMPLSAQPHPRLTK